MEPEMRDGQLFHEELERVLSSSSFARSDRVSKLLRFLVERHIAGRDDELKESLIGVEVFGRRPDYDPKLDSTVPNRGRAASGPPEQVLLHRRQPGSVS